MKLQGFRLGGKVVRPCDHARNHHPPHRPKHSAYHRLHHSPSSRQDPGNMEVVGTVKILDLGHSLSRFIRAVLQVFDQARVADGNKHGGSRRPPKGHMVVYVQGGGGDEGWSGSQRFLVPVAYVNHPLFVELLKEAEEKHEFHHHGGITIPCPISVFENVRDSIAANYADRCRKPTVLWKGFDATKSAVSCN